MPSGNQKVEDAIDRMHHAANNVIHHARRPESKSIEWGGIVWQKDLLKYAREYTKSVDRLTRIRSAVRRSKRIGI
jgi:hypothetical protein